MRNPVLALVGAAAVLAALPAGAQSTTPSNRTNLLNLMSATSVAPIRYQHGNATMNLSLRGGALLSPRTGGLVGADFQLPSLSLGNGWHGRLDADVIFKANFAGVNTIVPVTFDQLYYSAGGADGHNFYYGGGVGAVLGGPGVFDGKLILGTEITSRIGAEVNVHFTERDTLLTVLARLHM